MTNSITSPVPVPMGLRADTVVQISMTVLTTLASTGPLVWMVSMSSPVPACTATLDQRAGKQSTSVSHSLARTVPRACLPLAPSCASAPPSSLGSCVAPKLTGARKQSHAAMVANASPLYKMGSHHFNVNALAHTAAPLARCLTPVSNLHVRPAGPASLPPTPLRDTSAPAPPPSLASTASTQTCASSTSPATTEPRASIIYLLWMTLWVKGVETCQSRTPRACASLTSLGQRVRRRSLHATTCPVRTGAPAWWTQPLPWATAVGALSCGVEPTAHKVRYEIFFYVCFSSIFKPLHPFFISQRLQFQHLEDSRISPCPFHPPPPHPT